MTGYGNAHRGESRFFGSVKRIGVLQAANTCLDSVPIIPCSKLDQISVVCSVHSA